MYKVILFWICYNILIINDILEAIIDAIRKGLGSNICTWTVKSYWEAKGEEFIN